MAVAFLPVLVAAMTAVVGLSGNASASSSTTTLTDVSTLNCLDSNSSGNVYALSCNGGNYQNWIQQPVGGGLNKCIVNLIDAQTGRCLDSNPSGNIYTQSCNGRNFQHWQRSSIVTFQILDNSTAKCIGIDFFSGLAGLQNYNSSDVIGVGGGSTANGASLVQWPQVGHPDQYWTGA